MKEFGISVNLAKIKSNTIFDIINFLLIITNSLKTRLELNSSKNYCFSCLDPRKRMNNRSLINFLELIQKYEKVRLPYKFL
jgi:hypothetical protein